MPIDRKHIKVYFGVKKSKSLEIIVACLCGVFLKDPFLEIKFADIRLISLNMSHISTLYIYIYVGVCMCVCRNNN